MRTEEMETRLRIVDLDFDSHLESSHQNARPACRLPKGQRKKIFFIALCKT